MPAFPCIQTVDWWLDGDQSERYPQSKLMAQHNKAGSYERRLATYINEEFKMTGDLETYLYNTQLNQSEALAHAYRSWRRDFRGPGKEYVSLSFQSSGEIHSSIPRPRRTLEH
jgi:beta-mannosidase